MVTASESFANWYVSLTNQAEIGSSLKVINIENARNDDEDDYAALERLTKRINKLAPTARAKDREENQKSGF